MKYYYILCKVTSFLDTEINFNVVISEEPEEFALRMKIHNKDSELCNHFEMSQWKSTSKNMYNKLKKHNPSSESYLMMKKEDYGHLVEDE